MGRFSHVSTLDLLAEFGECTNDRKRKHRPRGWKKWTLWRIQRDLKTLRIHELHIARGNVTLHKEGS